MKTKVILCYVLWIIYAAAQDVRSGQFRGDTNRLNPFNSANRERFIMIRGPIGRMPLVRRQRPIPPAVSSDNLQTAALRAGEEGVYEYGELTNAILTDKSPVKPTKAPIAPENKINIESKVPPSAENDTMVEKVYTRKTAILHCSFDDVEQIGSFKQAKIWWTKMSDNGLEKPVVVAAGTQVRIPDERLRVIAFPDNSFSILVIKNSLPEDAGQYKCSLPTVTGTKTAFVILQVLEPKSEMVAISPKEHSLNSGEELNLFCRPEDPRLSVWWTAKDASGTSIMLNYGFDKMSGQVLTIPNIQRNQAGVYTCHIESGLGLPIRRHFNVQVKEKPWAIDAYIGGFQMNALLAKFYKDPVYGDNVNLRCDTGGVPTPTIQWYKDGLLLSSNSKYLISSFEPSYKQNSVIGKLTINRFQQTDDGTYICRASNDAGATQQEFNIQGKLNPLTSVTDDEDYGNAALKGRSGSITVKVCKGLACSSSRSRYEGSGGLEG